MIEPDYYCKVSGMVMECIRDFNRRFGRRPVILEIGCADGQGTMRFAGFADLTICIDPMVFGRPDLDVRTKKELPSDPETISLFTRRVQDFNVRLVQGCSLWQETTDEVLSILDGRYIDILVIDGCHHPFEAVWGDFDRYFHFVSKGGYVVFDDLYEDCILQAFERAIKEHDMLVLDRWSIKNENVLQDCAALRKKD